MRPTIGWTYRDEDGGKIEVEAAHDRNQWRFQRRGHRTEPWVPLDPPSVEDWERLLDVLQRKYQRRRCAWRDVEEVQHFLEAARKQENLP